jgi:ribosomal protein L14
MENLEQKLMALMSQQNDLVNNGAEEEAQKEMRKFTTDVIRGRFDNAIQIEKDGVKNGFQLQALTDKENYVVETLKLNDLTKTLEEVKRDLNKNIEFVNPEIILIQDDNGRITRVTYSATDYKVIGDVVINGKKQEQSFLDVNKKRVLTDAVVVFKEKTKEVRKNGKMVNEDASTFVIKELINDEEFGIKSFEVELRVDKEDTTPSMQKAQLEIFKKFCKTVGKNKVNLEVNYIQRKKGEGRNFSYVIPNFASKTETKPQSKPQVETKKEDK